VPPGLVAAYDPPCRSRECRPHVLVHTPSMRAGSARSRFALAPLGDATADVPARLPGGAAPYVAWRATRVPRTPAGTTRSKALLAAIQLAVGLDDGQWAGRLASTTFIRDETCSWSGGP
jgi:hypothetical protein